MGWSPEEIRHVSIKRSVRGYDRRATERLLAEIAESFEAVWHERTALQDDLNRAQADLQAAERHRRLRDDDVRELRERLQERESAWTEVRRDVERLGAEREAAVAEAKGARAELNRLREQVERLETERSEGLREEEHVRAEVSQLREHAERLRAEQERLLDQSKRSGEDAVRLREELDQLKADRSRLTEEPERLATDLDELYDELARVEADRGRLVQEAARVRAECVELRGAERSMKAELADVREQLGRLETERATLADELKEAEAELGMHPRVARRLRELHATTQARYGFSPPAEAARGNSEDEADSRPPSPDTEMDEESDEADRDPGLIGDLRAQVAPKPDADE